MTEHFLGRKLTSFKINPIVKAFIISELFVWSSWNFAIPILAVFVVNNIQGGSVELAAFAFSLYMIVRVVFELVSGKYLGKATERIKFLVTIMGILLLSVAFGGLALAKTVTALYLFIGLAGAGIGIATPAKNALFSIHLDKGKESEEWGLYDAVTFVGMALATALGGFIAQKYGFAPLFWLSAGLNTLGIFPYLLYIRK